MGQYKPSNSVLARLGRQTLLQGNDGPAGLALTHGSSVTKRGGERSRGVRAEARKGRK